MSTIELIKNYQSLDYVHKRMLQIMALSKHSVSRTDFLKISNYSYDLVAALGKNLSPQKLNEVIDALFEKKLLYKPRHSDVNVEVAHAVLLDATSEQFLEANEKLIKNVIGNNNNSLDLLKVGIYFNDAKHFKNAISEFKKYENYEITINLAKHFSIANLDENWLNTLLPQIQYWVVAAKICNVLKSHVLPQTQSIDVIKRVITKNLPSWDIDSDLILNLLMDFCVLDGDIENIKLLASKFQSELIKHHSILGVLDFLQNDNAKALVNFDAALKALKAASKKRTISLPSIAGVFHILALLKENNSANLQQIRELIKTYLKTIDLYSKAVKDEYYYDDAPEIVNCFTSDHLSSYYAFEALLAFLEFGHGGIALQLSIVLSKIYLYTRDDLDNVLDSFVFLLISYWTDSEITHLINRSKELLDNYGNKLIGLSSVVNKINSHIDDSNTLVDNQNQNNTPYGIDFTDIIHTRQDWERALDTLSAFFNNKMNSTRTYVKRLTWLVDVNKLSIDPCEQKKSPNGAWNKGRAISLKRLVENNIDFEYLTPQDRSVIKCIELEEVVDYSYYAKQHYQINKKKALVALASHPFVFDSNTNENIELIKTTPEFIVNEDKKGYQIMLSVYSDVPTVQLQKEEGTNRYYVLDISEQSLTLSKILGKQGITVPKSEKEKVFKLVQKASADVNVRANFDTSGAESKPADPTIILQLTVLDDLLRIKALVRPFGGKGAYFKPGVGNKNLLAKIDNENQSVIRNLKKEEDNLNKLLEQCPTLAQQENNANEWKSDEALETILEILYELNEYKAKNPIKDAIKLEWPQGQPISVDRELSFADLKLSITSKNQWFNFNGEVTIDEGKVMEMKVLLAKLEQSKGRFIELSDKKFIALTESFAKRLNEINVASKLDSDGQSIHKLGAPLLQEFAEKSKKVKTDTGWKSHIEKISKAEICNPEIPQNLQAELRGYQTEGFKWLSRLANLGFGACLADDMGLGKTVQTIALLLDQASIGPCLVVAPASVCYVWKEECKKFAPSLNCIAISENSSEREVQITNLGKMDVLICSYGILYQIEDVITQKQFQVVVLDEAQAIKNFNTKRFKIITQLNSCNRIALSGTPIENRTSELWNLFEFLNPGFLGKRELFQTKYIKPIEQDKNVIVRNTLKRLIQPFILRRIKSKVLDELPPKIEQTIFIEPTDQEKNFYEALRRDAVERIKSLDTASSAQKRFSVLAEITKLRRACCDSSLVDDKIELPNSKLEAFDEIVGELKENNHRALVFSQYVGYLEIVKKRLDKQNVKYQYLDGSCTQKQRQASVEDFQSGIGDLFLISLKAGGFGLNLTAADYVIHLDPWWNPAVEDQASDRAHRIGQTRPVTIYRLVMKYSIEEKILKMHQDKRELAISLLSDSDKSASLNESDLLELINSTFLGG